VAAPSLTYTLTNGATADASQVMQNYNDLLNGVTDGTKDLTINALTANGAASFKGAVTLGDATGDDITHTGALASTIPIKTNNSYDIGSATLGLAGLYLGNVGAGATCKLASASHATTRVYTFPDAGAAANVVLSEGAATINGAKTFGSGIIVGGNATGDSNLGTISSVTNSSYYEGSWSAVFNQGAGVSGSSTTYTINYVRSGKIVTLLFPGITATIGTTAANLDTAASSIPSSLRPVTAALNFLALMVESAVVQATPGRIIINTDGSISIRMTTTSANWTATHTSCGSAATAFTYTIQ